jgi:hypothetical protein
VLKVPQEPEHQLVDQRRLAAAASAGHAEHRDLPPIEQRHEAGLQLALLLRVVLRDADQPPEGERVSLPQPGDVLVERRRGGVIALREQIVDHPLQAERAAVVRRVDARDAVGVQLGDLGGQDGPAAAPEQLDGRSPLLEQVEHVLEELDVPALIAGDGDALRVLLDRAVDDVLRAAVVAEVDHLRARRLEDAPHDVDRRVVTVEEGRRGDDANRVLRSVGRGARHGGAGALLPLWAAGKEPPARPPGPPPGRRAPRRPSALARARVDVRGLGAVGVPPRLVDQRPVRPNQHAAGVFVGRPARA